MRPMESPQSVTLQETHGCQRVDERLCACVVLNGAKNLLTSAMRRFEFSLQKVLDYRQRREEQAIRAFAEAQAQLLHEQAVLHKLVVEREECLRRSHRRQRLTVDLLDVEQTYLSALEERIEAQRERVAEAEKVLEERQEALIEAQRERKALERLREKHYEQWRQEILRIEQKALDELATARSVRSPGVLTLHAGGEEHE